MLDISQLPTFLYYGYIPDAQTAYEFSNWLDSTLSPEPIVESDEHELVRKGISALKGAFVDIPSGDHVIPISGGLDSRTILANLLEHFEAFTLHTITYGTPGTWDYEIGNRVARKAGTKHVSFDLTEVTLDLDSILEYTSIVNAPIPLLEGYYNYLIPKCFGKQAIYWSGFMGDPLSGSHLCDLTESWDSVIAVFAEKNHYSQMDLCSPRFFPEKAVTKIFQGNNRHFTLYELIDFAYRQCSYIKPTVMIAGYTYQTPFLHPSWVNFILRVPLFQRQKQHLYRQILVHEFPKMFSLPTKNSRGYRLNEPYWKKRLRSTIERRLPVKLSRKKQHVDPGVNYIDFAAGIRFRDDLKMLVKNQIQDLCSRQIIDWFDPKDVLKLHLETSSDCSRALELLVSTELFLKARGK